MKTSMLVLHVAMRIEWYKAKFGRAIENYRLKMKTAEKMFTTPHNVGKNLFFSISHPIDMEFKTNVLDKT